MVPPVRAKFVVSLHALYRRYHLACRMQYHYCALSAGCPSFPFVIEPLFRACRLPHETRRLRIADRYVLPPSLPLLFSHSFLGAFLFSRVSTLLFPFSGTPPPLSRISEACSLHARVRRCDVPFDPSATTASESELQPLVSLLFFFFFLLELEGTASRSDRLPSRVSASLCGRRSHAALPWQRPPGNSVARSRRARLARWFRVLSRALFLFGSVGLVKRDLLAFWFLNEGRFPKKKLSVLCTRRKTRRVLVAARLASGARFVG